jgi:aromatic ring hydroxylase
MRTGAEYRQALRDGRKVWVMGDGAVEDVATHPATSAVAVEYVAWYDRHSDPAWTETVLAPPDLDGCRIPFGMVLPRSAEDLRGMGRCFAATVFHNAGNITHTPAYGHLIALGIETTVRAYGRQPDQIESATAYRREIARTGRFITFSSGAPTIGYRMREQPEDRAALRLVRETAEGFVISGKIGMHTSPAYADDVYVGGGSGFDHDGHRITFIVPVNARGVTVLCRKVSARARSPFTAPLSARNDELDGQMWLDEVLIPHERLFFLDTNIDPIARWLFWHQLYCWLAKAEFTLGLALACTDAMGLRRHGQTIDLLLDIVTDVQTVRSCITAAELDPRFTPEGYCYPNHNHIAAGSIAMLKARQRITETLRVLPGSSLIVAPSDSDLASPEMAAGFEESFGGGGYSATQRSALLQMAWDHVSSALDARESAYELHSNGGIPIWRERLRRSFEDYDTLANAVLQHLSVPMPTLDFTAMKSAPVTPRRPVSVVTKAG